MKSELQYLAELAIVDQKLDELQEDCGDLPPLIIKKLEKKVYDLDAVVKETEQIISDVKKFKSDSKLTLQTLKKKKSFLLSSLMFVIIKNLMLLLKK